MLPKLFNPSVTDVVERFFRRYTEDQFLPSVEFPNGLMRLFVASNYRRSWVTPSEWSIYDHQFCGMACDHLLFYGKEFHMHPEIEQFFRGIHHSWQDQAAIFGPVPLKDLIGYSASLSDRGLSCEGSYVDLNESVYPVDFSPVNMEILTGIKLHEDDLIKGSGLPISPLKIYIVGENSD